MEALLSLNTSDTQSPDHTAFPFDFLSGAEPYQTSPIRDANSFSMQSLPFASSSPIERAPSSTSLNYAHSYSGHASSYQGVSSMRPTHQKSSSDFLVPPSPTMPRNARSHSPGLRGHRHTISEGADPFSHQNASPESSLFLGEDFRGRGVARAKTVPSRPASRRPSPYPRPPSQTGAGMSLAIPAFTGLISGQSTPELECPSPGSVKDVVATDAMIQASAKRRTRDANFFCTMCGNSFTTENSRKRLSPSIHSQGEGSDSKNPRSSTVPYGREAILLLLPRLWSDIFE